MRTALRIVYGLFFGGLALAWLMGFEPTALLLNVPARGTSETTQAPDRSRSAIGRVAERPAPGADAAPSADADAAPSADIEGQAKARASSRSPADEALLRRLDARLARIEAELAAEETKAAPPAGAPREPARDAAELSLERIDRALSEVLLKLDGVIEESPDELAPIRETLGRVESELTALREEIVRRSEASVAPLAVALEQISREVAATRAGIAAIAEAQRLGQSALAERLGAIESGLAALGHEVGAISKASGSSAALVALDERIGAVAGQLAGLEEAVRRMTPPPTVDLAPLSERLSAIESRLEALASGSSGRAPAAALKSLESRIETMAERLETLEAAVADASRAGAARDEALLARWQEIMGDKLAAALDDVTRRMEEKLATTDQALGEPSARLDRIEGDMRALLGELAATRETTSAARTSAEASAERVAEIAEAMRVLRDRVAALAARPEPAQPDLGPVFQRLAELQASVAALAEEMERRPAPRPVEAALAARLEPIEERLQALAEAIARTDSTLEALGTRLARIEQALTVLRPGAAERVTGPSADKAAPVMGAGEPLADDDGTASATEEPETPSPEPPLPAPPEATTPAVTSPSTGATSQAGSGAEAPPESPEAVQATPPTAGEEVTPGEPAEEATGAAATASTPVTIVALDEAWMRVRDGDRIIFEGTVPPGGRVEVPPGLERPLLRSGNTGRVYLLVGARAFGPVGPPGGIVRRLPLDPEEIMRRFPEVDPALLAPAGASQAVSPDARVVVVARAPAWIRVRDGRRTLFEGLLKAGGRYEVPPGLADPRLRAGNAGEVYLVVDGTTYGPLGPPNGVVRRFPLKPAEIARRLPKAGTAATAP